MTEKISGTNYIRALGVILVLTYHFFPDRLKGGFLGVDVFFTFSGYLISASLMQRFNRESFNLLQFYKRRIFRLVPAAVFMTLLILPLTLLISPDFRVGILEQLTAALTFTTNYYEISLGQSYENFLLPRLFVHTWSLAVEMHFYLAWGMAAFFVCGLVNCLFWGIAKNNTPVSAIQKRVVGCGRALLFLLALAVGAFSYGKTRAGLQAGLDHSTLYYDTLSHAYPLMIGAVAGLFFGSPSDKKRRGSVGNGVFKFALRLLLLVSFAGILALSARFSFSDAATYQYGILAVSALSALIIVCIKTLHERSPIREPKNIAFIGAASYSLYLFHWPVYIIVTQWARVYAYRLPVAAREFYAGLAALPITWILAWFSYHYVENILRVKNPPAAATQAPRRGLFFRFAAMSLVIPLAGLLIFAVTSAPAITSIEESFNDNFIASDEVIVKTFLAEPPDVEAQEAPVVAVPPTEPPIVEAQLTEAPVVAVPPTEPPIVEAQPTEVPIVEVPPTEPPIVEVPPTEAPVVEAPPTEPPVVEAQPTEAPVVQAVAFESRWGNADNDAALISDRIVLIGDSVMVGAAKVLREKLPNVYIDAKVSRAMKNGLAIVKGMKDKGALREYIVIACATNTHADSYNRAVEIAELLEGYKVIFITNYGPSWMAWLNDDLRELPNIYPHVRIADWGEAIAPHSNQLAADGIHTGTRTSKEIYAECILDAIMQSPNETPPAEVQTPIFDAFPAEAPIFDAFGTPGGF